jgi:tripartite-type tricarboxylate transporter receptor subunit TctC
MANFKKVLLFAVILVVIASQTVFAQGSKEADFPNKPLTVIVPTGAGGGSDTVARKSAALVEKIIGQPINVVNVVGGGGVTGWEQVKRSAPDGYTLMLAFGELNTTPHQMKLNISYSDFQPLICLNKSPSVLTVRSDSGWNTLDDFIAYAKANPGRIRIGTAGSTTVWALGAAAIEDVMGVKFTMAPLSTSAETQAALLGGHVEAVTLSDGEVAQYVNNGDFRILAVLDSQRVESFPDVPTFKELGHDGVESFTWRGIALPKGTPKAIVDKLYEAYAEAASSQEFKDFMQQMAYPMLVLDPQEFEIALGEWDEHFKNLIELMGI